MQISRELFDYLTILSYKVEWDICRLCARIRTGKRAGNNAVKLSFLETDIFEVYLLKFTYIIIWGAKLGILIVLVNHICTFLVVVSTQQNCTKF